MAGTGDKLMTAADVKIVTDTCLKTSGGAITGPLGITDSTESTSKITGALTVSGGVGVSGTVYANGFNGPLTGTASRATADADGNAISSTYLKLTGGMMSGDITRSSSLTKGTNPSSDTYFTSHVIYQNGTSSGIANRVGGLIESLVKANGDSRLRFGAYRYSSGSSDLNVIDIITEKDGTKSYTVTSPSNFRSAINAVGNPDVANNLTTTDEGKVLDARQGKALKDAVDAKVSTSNVVNNLETTASGKVLDARQGKVLKDAIDALYFEETGTGISDLLDIPVNTSGFVKLVSAGISPTGTANQTFVFTCFGKSDRRCLIMAYTANSTATAYINTYHGAWRGWKQFTLS